MGGRSPPWASASLSVSGALVEETLKAIHPPTFYDSTHALGGGVTASSIGPYNVRRLWWSRPDRETQWPASLGWESPDKLRACARTPHTWNTLPVPSSTRYVSLIPGPGTYQAQSRLEVTVPAVPLLEYSSLIVNDFFLTIQTELRLNITSSERPSCSSKFQWLYHLTSVLCTACWGLTCVL